MQLDSLWERFRHHDRQALARLLTLAARGELAAIPLTPSPSPTEGRGEQDKQKPSASATLLPPLPFVGEGGRRGEGVVAFTGSAGVGKSTLIGKFIQLIRSKGQSVAVLACDPQSPLTGGALLGDRLRMPVAPDDPGVFIRSLATAGGHEGVAENLDLMIRLMREFGFDWVLVETVGAGQGDTAVRNLADAVVLLLQPESGDDIQWEKAGLLEIADVVVIHKADLPGADRMEAQVRSLLHLPGCREVPVLRVSAQKEQGLEELYQHLVALPGRQTGSSNDGRALLRAAQRRLRERFAEGSDQVRSIVERWRRGEIDENQAADLLLEALIERV